MFVQNFQLSLFYNPQAIVETSSFYRTQHLEQIRSAISSLNLSIPIKIAILVALAIK
jgi:hypothetical protein